MWKFQCAYTRWTPTNQYLHDNPKTNWQSSKITLARFGFVGWDEKCYWGLFGVQWVKPLPVYQVKSGKVAGTKATGTAGATGKSTPKNPVKYNGKTYDFVSIKKGGQKFEAIKTGKNKYLGMMWYNDGKNGWMPVETDNSYRKTTPKVFCKLVGLPWKNADSYYGNKKKKGYCDGNFYGPTFYKFNKKGLKYYWDLNCRSSDISKVKSIAQCSALSRKATLRGYDGCDSWIWCK